MRLIVSSLLAVVLLAATADAKISWPRARRPIDAATYDALLTAVAAEPFADGKRERIRNICGAKAYSFTAAQLTTLLAAFEFWVERLDALRVLPLSAGDRASANAVLLYFSGAPATMQSEARRILAID